MKEIHMPVSSLSRKWSLKFKKVRKTKQRQYDRKLVNELRDTQERDNG
jgi:hypothetical protein